MSRGSDHPFEAFMADPWGRYRGSPPYFAYGRPLWWAWCDYVCDIDEFNGAQRVNFSSWYCEDKTTLIQRVVRGYLVRLRRPLSLRLLSARVLVRADVGLQQSRQSLSPNDLAYVEKIRRSEVHTTGWERQHVSVMLETQCVDVGGGVHRLSPIEGVSSKRFKSSGA